MLTISNWYKENKDLLLAVPQVSITLGVLIVFYYCFFEIRYVPSGIDLSDSLMFIFISLGFGFLYTIFLMLNFFISSVVFSPIFNILHKLCYIIKKISSWGMKINIKQYIFILRKVIRKENLDACLLIMAAILAVLQIVLIFNKFDGSKVELFFVIIFVWFMFHIIYIAKEFKKRLFLVGVLFFVTMFADPRLPGFLINTTFFNLGMKKDNVSIIYNDSISHVIDYIEKSHNGMVGKSCHKRNTLKNINILWSRIGDETLIEIPLYRVNGEVEIIRHGTLIEIPLYRVNGEVEIIRHTLKNDSINIVKDSSNGCLYRVYDSLFDLGKSDNISTEKSDDIFNLVNKTYPFISHIDIYGMADPKGYSKGNLFLSKKRANYIKDILKNKNINLPIKSIGVGNFKSLSECKEKALNEKDTDDCNYINRGVELKLYLKDKDEDKNKNKDKNKDKDKK